MENRQEIKKKLKNILFIIHMIIFVLLNFKSFVHIICISVKRREIFYFYFIKIQFIIVKTSSSLVEKGSRTIINLVKLKNGRELKWVSCNLTEEAVISQIYILPRLVRSATPSGCSPLKVPGSVWSSRWSGRLGICQWNHVQVVPLTSSSLETISSRSIPL